MIPGSSPMEALWLCWSRRARWFSSLMAGDRTVTEANWSRVAALRAAEGRDPAIVAALVKRVAPGKIDGVPNQPKTPVTGIRIPLDLKASAAAKAASEETDLSKVVIRLLKEYVDPPKKRSRKSA